MWTLILYLLFGLTGMTLIKKSGFSIEWLLSINTMLGSPKFWIFFVGFLVYGISFLLYSSIIAKNEISSIIPILGGLVNIGAVLIGLFLFNENMNGFKFLGIICIIFGAIVIYK